MASTNQQKRVSSEGRLLRTAIVGGGRGCESVLRMAREDRLGRFRMDIVGVADLDEEAPGMVLARKLGMETVTTEYSDLYEIPKLDLIIELTGSDAVRNEIEQTRPHSVELIDQCGPTQRAMQYRPGRRAAAS